MIKWMIFCAGLVACAGGDATDAGGDTDLAIATGLDMATSGYRSCSGDSTDCNCFERSGKGVDSTLVCGDTSSLCCADTNWPAKDTGCDCKQKQQWVCTADPSGFCDCQWDYPSASDLMDQSCRQSSTTGYDYCCLDTSSSSPGCSCYNSAKFGPPPCATGETAVTSCLSSSLLPAPTSPSCLSTQHQIAMCNGG